jgi:hypothetical protein
MYFFMVAKIYYSEIVDLKNKKKKLTHLHGCSEKLKLEEYYYVTGA